MILRLLVWLLFGAAAVGVVALAARSVFRPRLAAWRARQRAAIAAELTCSGCGDGVDSHAPDTIFVRGHYWHRTCMKKLLA